MRFAINILILALIFVFSCKKYPENNLWFKRPQKAFKGGNITSIKVDGVDSLSYLNGLCGFDISKEKFTYFDDWKGLNAEKIQGSLRFGKGTNQDLKKKECGFVLQFYPNKNQFTINPSNPPYLPFERYSVWQIEKLTNKGQFKISLEKNGKLYEVQFN